MAYRYRAFVWEKAVPTTSGDAGVSMKHILQWPAQYEEGQEAPYFVWLTTIVNYVTGGSSQTTRLVYKASAEYPPFNRLVDTLAHSPGWVFEDLGLMADVLGVGSLKFPEDFLDLVDA